MRSANLLSHEALYARTFVMATVETPGHCALPNAILIVADCSRLGQFFGEKFFNEIFRAIFQCRGANRRVAARVPLSTVATCPCSQLYSASSHYIE